MSPARAPRILASLSASPWFANGLAVFGALTYFFHSRYYAFTQLSVLDEGAYLLKGLYFVNGTYTPFQDYGPLTNHMPLSFLIHGVVQALFGPGVREARYFMLFVGLLMLAGIWLVAYRLRGPLVAALVVWVIAINPATARFYSLATSQGLIACMLAWVLVLSLEFPGRKRSIAATTSGAALAALLALTRINLTPVLPLIILYIFWAHGRKAGWWSFAVGALTFLAGNLVFYPDILKIWGYWLPENLFPFLDPWRQPRIGRYWDPSITLSNRFYSFLEGLRLHFAAFTGLLFVPFFWRGKRLREDRLELRNLVLIIVLVLGLTVEHLLASLALDYCVYCYSVYLAFFSPVGVLLLALLLRYIPGPTPRFRLLVFALVIILFTTVLGAGAYIQIGETLARSDYPPDLGWLSNDNVPRYPIWDILQVRYDIPFKVTRQVLPAVVGFGTGLLFVAVGLLTGWRSRQQMQAIAVLFIVTGLFLTPSSVLGDGYRNFDCGQDTLSGYETLGRALNEQISTPQRVYWRGGQSVVPLLYVPGAQVYPPQINGHFALYDLDDPDRLMKFGLWSEALSDQWLLEADVVLVEGLEYFGELEASVVEAGLQLVDEIPAPFSCRPGKEILVFRKASP